MNPQYCVSCFREVFCGYLEKNVDEKNFPKETNKTTNNNNNKNNERNEILPYTSQFKGDGSALGPVFLYIKDSRCSRKQSRKTSLSV